MTARAAYLLALAVALALVGAIEVLDYIVDAPLRAQYERCVAGGSGMCDGLVTD